MTDASVILQARVQAALAAREAKANRRAPAVVAIEGVDFSSNDYLSLRADPTVIAAFVEAAQRYGLGAGASHLLGGHHFEHEALADALSQWTNRPCAALFASGFQAAIGAIGALVDERDAVVADRLIHACMLDAVKLVGVPLRRFHHNDLAYAQTLLQQREAKAAPLRWILCESLYSMDGDSPDLPALCALAEAETAAVMLDEAHAIGVLGAEGAGLLSSAPSASVSVQMLTFGKALGSAGAAIMGPDWLADAFANFSRAYIYSTAMPPAHAAATRVCVRLARTEQWRRDKLFDNVAYFQRRCKQQGIPLGHSFCSPIQFVPVQHSASALLIKASLAAKHVYVAAVRPPTVPPNQARLRITLNCVHTHAQIDSLIELLAHALK